MLPRVILADDHRLFMEAFSQLLQSTCQVVGTVTDGQELIHQATQLKPDMIFLDVHMPLLNGIDAGRK